jgi:FSR family fosmidomycin resistance protein-like MFS transporter
METSLNSHPPRNTLATAPAAGVVSLPASPQAGMGARAQKTVYSVLGAISFSHLLNDMIQSLILAIYPMLKANFSLTFGQIGLITLTYQITASLLQPFVGIYTDRRPMPFSLPVGMGFTLTGLLLMSHAASFGWLLCAAALVGCGSSVFHPESSRVARMASGGQHGLAQSVFQVGGNAGSALGPLLAATIVIPHDGQYCGIQDPHCGIHGQHNIEWFSVAALIAIIVLTAIGRWYRTQPVMKKKTAATAHTTLPRNKIVLAISVLLMLVFSKYFYLASINSYFTFYLMGRFHLPTAIAQLHLFIFLAAVAAGTIIGGPVGDRVGRKLVIWVSILGVAPFTLMLPYANLFWTSVLTVIIGLVLASAFSAIIVYAQELIPGKVGLIAGLFFGLSFGLGGVGAAVLGRLADATSIPFVYKVCSFLPLLGMLTIFLPDLSGRRKRAVKG